MSTATPTVDAVATAPRRTPARIPISRLVAVELRKSFDTRSGFWLLASIGILATLATGAVILFAPNDELTYETFATAIGFPMAIVLPMVAILSVTSEWSQRTGLTSFTLMPHRGRVIGAKALVALIVGVVSMGVALVIGALGNVVGTAITGTDLVWNVSVQEFSFIVLGNIIGMAVGFMLGVLIRNSPGAIVGYFVYSLVLPTITTVLSQTQEWFADNQSWIDFNYAQGPLFEGSLTGEQWAQLGFTGLFWLIIPLTIGVWSVLRSEVK
ncbi:ABC transporter permease subunit [Nocardioides sp. W7]|uniref:ABC transporter permease n=1 Tax=Nocardioides sp. W7 TaxID=2931390 RepID=UPI001FCFBF30|nr:ABC transporter permease subunit [Nocardioides sp. W7]